MNNMIDKLKVYRDGVDGPGILQFFDTEEKLTERNFYNHPGLSKPHLLQEKVEWLLGNKYKQNPISMMTIGAALKGANSKMSVSKKGINGFEYEYFVASEIDKNEVISSNQFVAGDQPGIGNTPFKIRFRSNWFKRGYVIESPNEIQLLIDTNQEPVPVNGNTEYEYTVRLVSAGPDEFCPLEELESGTMWTQMWAPGSQSESISPGGGNRVTPGKAQNQLMLIRAKREWGGNVANRTVIIDVPTPSGGTSKYWIDYDMWTLEREWSMAKETSMWYSKYNKDSQGAISLLEAHSGATIPQGSGLLEQIPNVFTYNRLTYTRIKQMIMDVFFGMEDTYGQTVKLYTGLGGMDEFDRAIKEELNSGGQYAFNTTNDKVVSGQGQQMEINGFFTKVYFIGGYNVHVIHNPVFDLGKRALKSPKHPETGLPMESYRMVFLDTDNYEGDSNITYVYEEGREYKQKIIKGMADLPASLRSMDNAPSIISSEKDSSSVHRQGTCGIIMKRPGKSLHGICTLS